MTMVCFSKASVHVTHAVTLVCGHGRRRFQMTLVTRHFCVEYRARVHVTHGADDIGVWIFTSFHFIQFKQLSLK